MFIFVLGYLILLFCLDLKLINYVGLDNVPFYFYIFCESAARKMPAWEFQFVVARGCLQSIIDFACEGYSCRQTDIYLYILIFHIDWLSHNGTVKSKTFALNAVFFFYSSFWNVISLTILFNPHVDNCQPSFSKGFGLQKLPRKCC